MRLVFPENYIFQPFKPLYKDAFLQSFIDLLLSIPSIPKNTTLREFIRDVKTNSDETELELRAMIERFEKNLTKRALKYLNSEGKEIVGVFSAPTER
ncbi:MAG: hypothetical protein V2I33_19680 [Kangiellaceae bacterium]|nr:hypothetical protein [Kangiellaceae bacterium]